MPIKASADKLKRELENGTSSEKIDIELFIQEEDAEVNMEKGKSKKVMKFNTTNYMHIIWLDKNLNFPCFRIKKFLRPLLEQKINGK